MKNNYVIINIETNGYFNRDDDKQIIFIEALKVDAQLNEISSFKTYIRPKARLEEDVVRLTGFSNEILESGKTEKEALIDFIKFCENSSIITHNAKFELSFILKSLYKNGIKDTFKFKYIDIKKIFKNKTNIISKFTWNNIKKHFNLHNENDIDNILDVIKIYFKENGIDSLERLFSIQPFHGQIFRGLNYPKYLCDVLINDNKYFGYIVDLSEDKYISYYAFLKELNNEYFNLDEILNLKSDEAIVIMNVYQLCEELLSFTDYYSVLAHDEGIVTKDCYDLINGISRYIEYKKLNEKVRLVLWGNIELLRKTYKVVNENILEEFISYIDIVKEPWSFWKKEELIVV